MAKDNNYFVERGIVETINRDRFIVKLGTGSMVTCTLSGAIRKNIIRIVAGDHVEVDVNIYDTSKGIIKTRLKNFK